MSQPVSRRSFLRLLGMAAPVAAAAPKYFFAPVGGWKSDVIVNPGDITIEMLQEAYAQVKFGPMRHHDHIWFIHRPEPGYLYWSKNSDPEKWPEMRQA